MLAAPRLWVDWNVNIEPSLCSMRRISHLFPLKIPWRRVLCVRRDAPATSYRFRRYCNNAQRIALRSGANEKKKSPLLGALFLALAKTAITIKGSFRIPRSALTRDALEVCAVAVLA